MTYNVMVDDMDTVIDTTNMTYNVMVDDMDTVIDCGVSCLCHVQTRWFCDYFVSFVIQFAG